MSEHLFPRYHVRPPTGYMNDPNGPILVGGLAHLYYQYRPTLDLASPVLWGHVTSTDLVHWDYHRPAITPHPQLGDRGGCWSGNTVLDDSSLVRAFYSGNVKGEPLQRTLSATSSDGGFSFARPREVVESPAAVESIEFLRDPFVWRDGPTWRMAPGAGTSDETAMVRLYESDDLETCARPGGGGVGRALGRPRPQLLCGIGPEPEPLRPTGLGLGDGGTLPGVVRGGRLVGDAHPSSRGVSPA